MLAEGAAGDAKLCKLQSPPSLPLRACASVAKAAASEAAASPLARSPGTQITCCTGTKVQILTPPLPATAGTDAASVEAGDAADDGTGGAQHDASVACAAGGGGGGGGLGERDGCAGEQALPKQVLTLTAPAGLSHLEGEVESGQDQSSVTDHSSLRHVCVGGRVGGWVGGWVGGGGCACVRLWNRVLVCVYESGGKR